MKKLFICFILLAGAMLMQAQVRRTPAQRTQTQQPSTVVVKETEPLIVNGHLAFLGIPVKQSRAILGNLLKGKGFLQKDDGYGNIRWEGTQWNFELDGDADNISGTASGSNNYKFKVKLKRKE